MRTIILSAIGADADELRSSLGSLLDEDGSSVRWVDLAAVDFGPCVGCGGCAKTGRCVLKDAFTEIVAGMSACDRLVLATPIFLGVHHPLMKKAVDRFLPLAGELFAVRQGEMHHQSRMERPFSIIGIGILGEDALPEEAVTFERLIARHAVNMACPAHAAVVIRSPSAAERLLSDAIERTERA